jgi:hypothetical protein
VRRDGDAIPPIAFRLVHQGSFAHLAFIADQDFVADSEAKAPHGRVSPGDGSKNVIPFRHRPIRWRCFAIEKEEAADHSSAADTFEVPSSLERLIAARDPRR